MNGPTHTEAGPATAKLTLVSPFGDLDIMRRRAQGMAEFFEALARAREPADVVSAQIGYWTHLMADYGLMTSDAPDTPAKH